MEFALDILTAVFLTIGSLVMIIGGIGVLRFPDFFSRVHGAGLTDTAGAGFILTGLMFQSGLSAVTIRLVFILLFLWFTGPVAGNAVSRSALTSGLQPILDADER